MDAGQIVEFDEPYSLLKPGKGVFFEMVQQTGKAETEHLLDIAKEAAQKRSVGDWQKRLIYLYSQFTTVLFLESLNDQHIIKLYLKC